MKKLQLDNVTLYGADTINLDRQIQAFEICMKYADFSAMKIFTNITDSYVTNTGIKIIGTNMINSLYDYNNFNLKHLNSHIDTDFVMIAEHDGFILNPDAWMDEFLTYDYIGAPWINDDTLVVGNGGFSLRSKKLLTLTQHDPNIKLGSRSDHRYAENEDWVIGVVLRDYIESKGITFAPVEIARKFSIEKNDIVGRQWTDQFGFHGLKWTDISKWIAENPGYKIDNPIWYTEETKKLEEKIASCKDGKFIFSHDTIALFVDIDNLTEEIYIDDKRLVKKHSFHVSLVCIGEIIKKNPQLDSTFMENVIDDFCAFVKEYEVLFEKYKNQFYIVTQKEKVSLIVMCSISHINKFFDFLNKKYGISLDYPPTHVTLYTLQENSGIFVSDSEDLQNLAKKVVAPPQLKGFLNDK